MPVVGCWDIRAPAHPAPRIVVACFLWLRPYTPTKQRTPQVLHRLGCGSTSLCSERTALIAE